ncbi:Inosose dehydratase [compost metagenome]
MKAPSGHFDLDTYLEGKGDRALNACIEAANITGGKYITIPYLQPKVRKTADDYKKTAQKFNEAGQLCKAAGLKLAYHNHDFEFAKMGDTTGYEILLQETDKNLVDFEMDLYWVRHSGADPIALFKAYPKRFTMWHVKDMDKQNKNLNAEIGQGAIDFKSIFAAAKLSGVKHYFVEHETNYKPDELGSIKTSFEYIKNNLL